MFVEGEDQPNFKPNWKAVFARDFCAICKNRNICPQKWECHDMKVFIEENECYNADLDYDNTL